MLYGLAVCTYTQNTAHCKTEHCTMLNASQRGKKWEGKTQESIEERGNGLKEKRPGKG